MEKTLYSKYEPFTKNLYNKYEPVAEKWFMLAWYNIHQFPFVPQLVEVLILPSAYCVEKYNYGVQYLSEAQYRVASYIFILHVRKIKNTIYKELERKEGNQIEINHEIEDKGDTSESH